MKAISKKLVRFIILALLTTFLLNYFSINNNQILAAEKSTNLEVNTKELPVTLDNKTLFYFKVQIPGFSPKARAKRVDNVIKKIAEDTNILVNDIHLSTVENGILISTQDEWILLVTNLDAQASMTSVANLAQNYLDKIQAGITEYRQKRNPERIFMGMTKTIISTIIFLIILILINLLFRRIYNYIILNQLRIFRPLQVQSWQLLSSEQQVETFLRILKISRLFFILLVLYFYIPLVLSFFAVTERFGHLVFSSFLLSFSSIWNGFCDYLPNLFKIAMVILISHYIIRIFRIIFQALENRTLAISGFYPDWAQPTYRLTTFLVFSIAAAIIAPYLPGFNSPAFQGISLLVGAIITFGGASTISNIFGGFVTIYTRAFQLGDRITVAEFTGVVIEKSILSTRICTINNEIVTIPNSSIVASSIKNFSASLRDIQQPLILTTTVTLGYDLPWRLIHQTLIEAALATQEILADPPPTIWQKSLDDFYVSYELRCCTKFPSHFKEIYTELHANIQDKCNQAGIEIMSPSYTSLRDGNQTTIPTNYLDKAYRSTKFNVEITSPEEEKSI